MTDTPNDAPLPDDEPTEEELAAAGTIRPLDELPSPWTVIGDPAILSQPTLAILSQEDQQKVRQRANSNDPDAIQAALMDHLRDIGREFRIRCGAGDGATATEREALDQLNQARLLSEEYGKLEMDLEEVARHETTHDELGKPTAVPVFTYQGSIRAAKEARMVEIKRQLALLSGHEGQAAMQKAARTDALKIRSIKQQLADQEEIRRRAHEMERNERLDAAARAKAKVRKSTI